MKIARTVLIIAALLCFALPSFAVVNAFMAFDVANQKMYAVVQGDNGEPLIAEVVFTQEDSSGFIGDTCVIEQPEPDKLIAEVCMGPIDTGAGRAVVDGHENAIIARITIYAGRDRNERTDEIFVRDTLVAHVNPYRSEGYYTYRAETCVPIMPPNIPISSAFCAWVCHGSYVIPIVCEDPNYTPSLLEVTVTNGCVPGLTHCNQSCPQITWGVFNWYKRVLPGCRLYLVMTYGIADPGCVCIWRSDFFLPVEILDFSQASGDHRVQLNWRTASETDVESYIITRSTVPGGGGIYEEIPPAVAAHNDASVHHYSWVDESVENDRTYYYKLVVKDADGQHVYNVDNLPVILEARPSAKPPLEYGLAQNFPNPFNSQTSFTFAIPENGHVLLKVFDLLGREVATVVDKDMNVNTYTVNWSAEGLPTGVYMYTLTSGEFSQTKKMLYLK